MGYNTQALVDGSMGQPHWLANDRFWYRVLTARGSEFILVDPARKTRTVAFDQAKLAAALSAASGKTYEAGKLPFRSVDYSDDEKGFAFAAGGQPWNYDIATGKVSPGAKPAAPLNANGDNEVESPDGKLAAFIKDDNLWVRDTKTNQLTQLTTDGAKDYGYATDNAGWTHSDKPVLRWSPDSRKIATFRQDQRHVGDMYLVTTNIGAPKLKAWKYPLPGDKDIATIERVIIEVSPAKVVRLQTGARPAPGLALGRYFEQRHLRRRGLERRRPRAGLRVDFARPQGGENAGGRCRHRRGARGVFRKPWPRSTSRARAPSTGATCPKARRLSGTRSATTGATSTSTMPAPAR